MMARAEWVVATSNAGKVLEIRSILAHCDVTLLSLADFGEVDFPDEGLDYATNALEKARAAASQLGVVATADDSGLEVKALGGSPGPLSARYGGGGLSDAERVSKLLQELEGVRGEDRAARFVCAAALVTPEGESTCVRGECQGRIVLEPRGEGGFGYDPVFQVEGRELTMAEVPAEEKDRISHRARAFRSLWKAWEARER
jgi:XTP/dITP diphosphohydrolase